MHLKDLKAKAPADLVAMAEELGICVARDLETAVGEADIVTCATMSTDPVLKGV